VFVMHSVEMHCVSTAQSRGALFVCTAQCRDTLCAYCTVWIVSVCGLHRLETFCVRTSHFSMHCVCLHILEMH